MTSVINFDLIDRDGAGISTWNLQRNIDQSSTLVTAKRMFLCFSIALEFEFIWEFFDMKVSVFK